MTSSTLTFARPAAVGSAGTLILSGGEDTPLGRVAGADASSVELDIPGTQAGRDLMAKSRILPTLKPWLAFGALPNGQIIGRIGFVESKGAGKLLAIQAAPRPATPAIAAAKLRAAQMSKAALAPLRAKQARMAIVRGKVLVAQASAVLAGSPV